VVLFGAVAFYWDEGEYFWDKDASERSEQYVGRTFVDAMYFASVIATSVGYGHKIVPLTDSAKGFLIFYFFFATVEVGRLTGDVVDLFVNSIVGERVIETLIDSTTWVHKADTDSDGRVSEADYVLFKLQQMLKVDMDMLERLLDRFHDLDSGGEGSLDVGLEIPSAAQVREMQRIAADNPEGATLAEMWKDVQAKLRTSSHPLNPDLTSIWHQARAVQEKAGKARKLSPIARMHKKGRIIHDFAWSRMLWSNAALQIAQFTCVLTAVYLAVAYYLLAYREGMFGIDGAYYLAATMTTVGFGDFAPTTQVSRGCAVLLLPCGLVVLSLVMSFFSAHTMARIPSVVVRKGETDRLWAATSLQAAWRGRMTRKGAQVDASVVASDLKHLVDLPKTSEERAAESMQNAAVQGLALLLRCVVVVTSGALFFKLFPDESRALQLTWVDAFYFAVETSTTVGYGDIVPSSLAGKLFMIFYMFFGTVIMGGAIGGFINLYVNGIVGEGINVQLIESFTWVHKADIDGSGKISESEYVLFKLQQMQKVDLVMLDRLVDRYHALDVDNTGYLTVGVEIPSAKQVARMEAIREELGGDKSLAAMWGDVQARIKNPRAFLNRSLEDICAEVMATSAAAASLRIPRRRGAAGGAAGMATRNGPVALLDRVEVRDGAEAWEMGTVVGIGPQGVSVQKDGWDESFVWDEMRVP